MTRLNKTFSVLVLAILLASFVGSFPYLNVWQIKPAYADTTFGKTSIGANIDWWYYNRTIASKATCTETGTVQTVHAYLHCASASDVKAGIYWDSNMSLIASSASVSVSSWAWYTFTLTASVSAQDYWLGFIGCTQNVYFRYDDGGNYCQQNIATYDFADPLDASYNYAQTISIYASYSLPSGFSVTSVGTNTTQASKACLFYSNWTAETNTLGGYIFGTNNTGSWTNETWASFGGAVHNAWANVTKTLNATVGNVVQWEFWGNDSVNAWENTGLQSLSIAVAIPESPYLIPALSSRNGMRGYGGFPTVGDSSWTVDNYRIMRIQMYGFLLENGTLVPHTYATHLGSEGGADWGEIYNALVASHTQGGILDLACWIDNIDGDVVANPSYYPYNSLTYTKASQTAWINFFTILKANMTAAGVTQMLFEPAWEWNGPGAVSPQSMRSAQIDPSNLTEVTSKVRYARDYVDVNCTILGHALAREGGTWEAHGRPMFEPYFDGMKYFDVVTVSLYEYVSDWPNFAGVSNWTQYLNALYTNVITPQKNETGWSPAVYMGTSEHNLENGAVSDTSVWDLDFSLATANDLRIFGWWLSNYPSGILTYVNGLASVYQLTGVTVTVTTPLNTTYSTSSVPVQLSASGGTIDKIWYNCKNFSTWIYGSNQTYTTATSMTDFVNGTSYTFYAWANNTGGLGGEETVGFSVQIPPSVNHYQYSFVVKDLDGNVVNSLVSCKLYNGSTLLQYVESEYTLVDGTYTLKTYYHSNKINETSLPTATYGNTTINIYLQFKSFFLGYLAFNNTVTGLVLGNQSAYNTTFTVSGSTPVQITIDFPQNPSYIQQDGTNISYSYEAGYITMDPATLSTFQIIYALPPSEPVVTVVFPFSFPAIRIDVILALNMIAFSPLLLTVLIVVALIWTHNAPPIMKIIESLVFTTAVSFALLLAMPVIDTILKAWGI